MHLSSIQILQDVMVRVLHRLNKQTRKLKTLTKASPKNCVVNFEFGVANSATFNFLDEKELQLLEDTLKKQALRILDFFCVLHYYIIEGTGRRKPLRVDSSMLRFVFSSSSIELFIHHERGIQHFPLEDFVFFIQNEINRELNHKQHMMLTLEFLHAL